ncbi:MAG: protein jag [Solirubrobacterales bacterium]
MADEPETGASAGAPQRSEGAEQEARAQGEGASVGAAKWAAMKELEHGYPGITVDHVEFEVVDEGAEEDDPARVTAVADLARWRESEREFHWPDEPTERVREVLKRLIAHLGLRGSVDVTEREDEIFADVSGPELGLLIGKHGSTLDAIQFVCAQAAFRGSADRKRVTVDAAGYRERREAALRRQADRGVADALRYGRPVELDSMGSQERRAVHTYLKDHLEVDTHSEGEEPFRRIVITPLRPAPSG